MRLGTLLASIATINKIIPKPVSKFENRLTVKNRFPVNRLPFYNPMPNVTLTPIDSARNLGVVSDNNLTFS